MSPEAVLNDSASIVSGAPGTTSGAPNSRVRTACSCSRSVIAARFEIDFNFRCSLAVLDLARWQANDDPVAG